MPQAYLLFNMQRHILFSRTDAPSLLQTIEKAIVAEKRNPTIATDLFFIHHIPQYIASSEADTLYQTTYGIHPSLLPYSLLSSTIYTGTVGCPDLLVEMKEYSRIICMGLFLDTHILMNSLALKTQFPQKEICILDKGCASTVPQIQKPTYEILSACHITIFSTTSST